MPSCFNPRDRRHRSRRRRSPSRGQLVADVVSTRATAFGSIRRARLFQPARPQTTIAAFRARVAVSTRAITDIDRGERDARISPSVDARFKPRDRRHRSRRSNSCAAGNRPTSGFNPRDRRQRSRHRPHLTVSTRATADNDRDLHRASLEQFRLSGFNPRDRRQRSRPADELRAVLHVLDVSTRATADNDRDTLRNHGTCVCFNPRDHRQRSRRMEDAEIIDMPDGFNPRDLRQRSRPALWRSPRRGRLTAFQPARPQTSIATPLRAVPAFRASVAVSTRVTADNDRDRP